MKVSPAEALEKMTNEGFVYVDVRTAEEFAAGHPKGAINVPISGSFATDMTARFAKDAKIIVGCKQGPRSADAARVLVAVGFTNVLDQRAGWDGARGSFGEILEPGWRRAGLPAE